MLQKVISSMGVAATALAGLVISAPAAHAVITDHVDGVGGRVPYNACASFTYDWAASDESGTASTWEATATLYQPDGGTSDSDDTWGDGGYATDSNDFSVCWDEGAGSYMIEVDLVFYDEYDNVVDSGSAMGSLEVTREPRPAKARTRSFLRISDRTPHYNERVAFAVRSQVRRDGEWRRHRHAYMGLAGRCATPRGDTGWVALAAGRVNKRGVGYVQFRYNIPRSWRCRYVSVTVKTKTTKASVSDRVSVRTGRSSSATVDGDQGAANLRGAEIDATGDLAGHLGADV